MDEILERIEAYKTIYLVLSYQERINGFSQIVSEWRNYFNAEIYLWNFKYNNFILLNKYYKIKEKQKKENSQFHYTDEIEDWIAKEASLLDDYSNEQFNPLSKTINILNRIYKTQEKSIGTIYVIKNIDILLTKGSPENKALLETYIFDIIERFRNKKNLYLVLIGKNLIDWEYNSIIPQLFLPLPTELERKNILKKHLAPILQTDKKEENKEQQSNKSPIKKIKASKIAPFINKCSTAVGGLSKQELEWGLQQAKTEIDFNSFDPTEFSKYLLSYKESQLANLKLKFLPPPELKEIGGMEELEEELENVKAQYNSSLTKKLKLPYPKGWVLAGSPGTGKSMAAKLAANRLSFPLISVASDDLKAKGILHTVNILKRIEKCAPCVLLLDELDKLFGSYETQGDLTKEVLGIVLTWLQEKTAPVFVVATLNRISGIPPEIVRSGRFDEKFHVEYPSPGNRYKIFKIHLKRFDSRYLIKEIMSQEEWQILINETERYTGAEIEQIVVSAVRKINREYYEKGIEDASVEIGYKELMEARNKVVSLFQQDPNKIYSMENDLHKVFRPVARKDDTVFATNFLPSWDN